MLWLWDCGVLINYVWSMIDVILFLKKILVDKGFLILWLFIKKMIYKFCSVVFCFKRMNLDNFFIGIFLMSNEIEINVIYFDFWYL